MREDPECAEGPDGGAHGSERRGGGVLLYDENLSSRLDSGHETPCSHTLNRGRLPTDLPPEFHRTLARSVVSQRARGILYVPEATPFNDRTREGISLPSDCNSSIIGKLCL